MRGLQRTRFGLWCAGFLLLASLAPANLPTSAVDSSQKPDDQAIRESVQAKIRAATEILAMCREFLVGPPGERGTPSPLESAEQIQYWSRQLTDAKLEAAEDRAERLKILTEAVDRAKGYESEIKDLAINEASGLTKLSAARAVYYRADAESRLLRERARPESPPEAR